MARMRVSLADLHLLAGSACLDLANTIDPREGTGIAHDYLQSYADLIHWSQLAGLIDVDLAERLDRRAAAMPSTAQTVFHRAITLREAAYSVFSALAAGAPPPPADLLIIDQVLRESMHSVRLTWNGTSADWQPVRENPALDLPLLQVARSAIELLARLPTEVVKRCPGAGDCGWLFLDKTKNRSRRWCRSDGCGARVKMRRRYRRTRSTVHA